MTTQLSHDIKAFVSEGQVSRAVLLSKWHKNEFPTFLLDNLDINALERTSSASNRKKGHIRCYACRPAVL